MYNSEEISMDLEDLNGLSLSHAVKTVRFH